MPPVSYGAEVRSRTSVGADCFRCAFGLFAVVERSLVAPSTCGYVRSSRQSVICGWVRFHLGLPLFGCMTHLPSIVFPSVGEVTTCGNPRTDISAGAGEPSLVGDFPQHLLDAVYAVLQSVCTLALAVQVL